MTYDVVALLDRLFEQSDALTVMSPADLPADWWLEWDERAAVMEYHGGMSRDRAEAPTTAQTLSERHVLEVLLNRPELFDAAAEPKEFVLVQESKHLQTVAENVDGAQDKILRLFERVATEAP